jgi:Histidine kinase/Two component regulator propeller
MYFYRTLCIGVIFFVNLFIANAQSFKYTQFTTYNGLPIDNVYAAAQDDNGFIWFGTDFGISKFDGYQFQNFNRNNGIATKAITDIVYAGGDSSIFSSYPNTIQSIHGNGKINTLLAYTPISVEQITKHKNKYYYYQRNMPLFGILGKGKPHLYYNINTVLHTKDVIIHSIASLNESGIAFCTNKGIFIESNNIITKLLPNEDVYYLLQKKDKSILVATTTHLKNANEAFEFNSSPCPLPKGFLAYNIVDDGSGNVWLRGAGAGIYYYSNNDLQNKEQQLGLQNKVVNKFFVDKQNNTWFCTDGAGVLFKSENAFTNYETQDGLANNKVIQLLHSNSKIVIGTTNGVSIKDGNRISPIALPNNGVGLKYVYKLFKDVNTDFGICIVNTFSFDNNLTKQISIAKNKITAVNSLMAWQQNKNTYWVFGNSTVQKIENGIVKESYSLLAFGIRKLYDIIEYNNKIYIATTDGIAVIENKKISYLPKINNQKLGEVFQFLIDKKNTLWIATEKGLITFHNGVYKILPKVNSYGGNYCKAIAMDNENKIWCATWDGIFETDGIARKNYSTSNGLISKTCHSVLYDSAANQLYIGTDNGLSVINKNALIAKNSMYNLFATCYYDSNQVSNNTTLKSFQNNLSFYCNVPNFAAAKNIKYEYKIDNKAWIISVTPLISLSNIEGGDHFINFRARLNGDIISTNQTDFKFTIKRKFYKTWWFWILFAIALQYWVFRIINYYNKKTRERKLLLQNQEIELTTLKQQAFTSLMNPHFIFNALNSIQHYINKQDRQMANKYLSDFAMLVRKSFDAAQKPFVPLEDELETIKLYLQLEQMRFANKFDYSITIKGDVDEDDWMIPSMVLQPFLENAIIHGIAPIVEKGKVEIVISAEYDTLCIMIADNGIGIEKSKQLKTNTKHISKGMYLIKERLQLLSRYSISPIQLSITTNNTNLDNSGTCIKLTIPQAVIEQYNRHEIIGAK